MKTARRCAALAFLLAAFVAANAACANDEIVAVRFNDGRTLQGVADARTNNAKLWLRMQQGAVIVLRPFERQLVASLEPAADEVVVARAAAAPRLTFAQRAQQALFNEPLDEEP